MKAIGIDIGTTGICAAVIDAENGEVSKVLSFPNSFFIKGRDYERIQNAEGIIDACTAALDTLLDEYTDVKSIGITGQMHGVVYLDADGGILSPLYTWQDKTGDEKRAGGASYADALRDLTGRAAASGFGLTTAFAHSELGRIPAKAAKICTIHDLLAMKLSGRKAPVMHTSDAASFGLFAGEALDFDREAVKKAGLDPDILPEVVSNEAVLGTYRGIPVSAAIGDNQASFIGSVRDMKSSVLLNVGTGSQISFLTDSSKQISGTELRPCTGKSFIRVGSALCGGSAFAALESFIRQTANLCGGEIKSAYPFIDAYLDTCNDNETTLNVATLFCGTRDEPSRRGEITGLGLENFTPGDLILGVLHGITDELYQMYKSAGETNHTFVVGSGNALRKNKALQRIIESTFSLKLLIPSHREEAAFGAALFGLTAAGVFASLSEAQSLIRYEQAKG